MSATADRFLQMLDLMLGPMLNGDRYRWVVEGISLLEAGPCAILRCNWPDDGGRDLSACMSLRYESKGFELRAETCTMGRYTSDACAALTNRFTRAIKALHRAR